MASRYEKLNSPGPPYGGQHMGSTNANPPYTNFANQGSQQPPNNHVMGASGNAGGPPTQNTSLNGYQNYSPQGHQQQMPAANYGTSGVQYIQLNPPQKSVVEAYLLWFVFGLLGGHHLYLRRPWYALAYFLTFGLLGFGWLADMFRMSCLVRDANLKLMQPQTAHYRSRSDAYVLWFPFGLLGFHLFYLRRPGQGVLYLFTFGLFGIGWLVDMFRIPSMVKQCNELPPGYDADFSVFDTYMFWLPPLGVLGGHHFYLRRYVWGFIYFFSFGLFGVGWLVDFCRIPILTKRANLEKRGELDKQTRYLDEAYVLWFPYGIIGLHHFYLHRPVWGLLYFFTYGLVGIGWLIDSCRLPGLVREYNLNLGTRRRLEAHRGPGGGPYVGPGSGGLIGVTYGGAPGVMPYPSAPAYESSYPGPSYLNPPAYEGPTPAGQQDPYGQEPSRLPPSYAESVGASSTR